jgi:FkbM family methyltransferase
MSSNQLLNSVPGPLRRAARTLGLTRFIRPLLIKRYGMPAIGMLEGYRVCDGDINLYANGSWEPDVSRIVERVVQPGWTCVDVGAHKGYYTLLLAKLVGPSGRVVSFEAHPDNAAAVRRNVKINGLDSRVRVENLAISDSASKNIPLYFGRRNSSYEWNILGQDLAGNVTEQALTIGATSLDAYFPPGSRIDFVKMDIEGAEKLALVGMRRLLNECHPVVAVEFHDDLAWAKRDELLNAGYSLYDIALERWVAPDHATRIYECLAVPSQKRALIDGGSPQAQG